MNIVVRSAETSDLPGPAGLDRLRAAIAEELHAERGGPLFLADRADRTTESMLAASHTDGSRLDVVLADDALVGWAFTRVRTLTDGTKVATIEELAVDAEARAIGAGEALLDATLAWCREIGCSGVDSFALPGARETKNFFETFGLKARLLTVHVDLRNGDSEPQAPDEPDAAHV